MSSHNHEPLRVIAKLRTPVVCDAFLPLDAIVHYQVCRQRFGAQEMTTPGGNVARGQYVFAPFKIINHGCDDWFYACSFVDQSCWLAEGQDHWNKRFDQTLASLIDFRGRKECVNISQGRYKAYHMPIFYRIALDMIWHCVGDKERLQSLLQCCTHIGKKIAQGWGRVREWRVEPWAEDWSCWREGKPTRAIPIAAVADGTASMKRGVYGIRPSYYARKNQRECVLP